MRMPWRLNRFALFAAVLFVGLASVAVWVKLEYYPSPIEGVCRSLHPGHAFEPVPGDVLGKAAQTSDVRLRDLAQPTEEQLETTRAVMLLQAEDPTQVARSIACLVDYSRSGRLGDPDANPPIALTIERSHVPALLVYRDAEMPVSPCFGGPSCGDEPTYTIHCAGFNDATTGQVLRVEHCWGVRDYQTQSRSRTLLARPAPDSAVRR